MQVNVKLIDGKAEFKLTGRQKQILESALVLLETIALLPCDYQMVAAAAAESLDAMFEAILEATKKVEETA